MAASALLLWLPFLIILPLVLLAKKKRDGKRKAEQLPPGPPKLPFIGNLHQLGSLPHRALWELSKRYGPVMFLKLGAVPTVTISSAEFAKQVLTVYDLECCSRPKLSGTGKLSYNYHDIAFAPYGDYWREMRRISVLELLSPKRVQSFQYIREEEVALLIESIAKSSSSERPVDLSKKSHNLTANITCRIAFGRSFRGSEFAGDKFEEKMQEAMAMLDSRCATDFFPSVGWIIDRLTGFHRRLERSFHEMDSFFQQVIDDHVNPERMKPEKGDIVDSLLRLERGQTNSNTLQLTKDHIKAIAMDIFVGGIDTGAVTIVWVMTELAKNPRVMKKAQEEVRRCVGKKGNVAESDLGQLQFLKMVVKETFRLHPPGSFLIPRETISHFRLNGYDIYPKTRMLINAWGIGRDPKIWDNPEEFKPERFKNSPIDFKGQNFELIPFGAGRRGCPGMSLGSIMVELAVANLLYSFDWKLPNGMTEQDIDMEEIASQTVCKKIPLSLVPTVHQI